MSAWLRPVALVLVLVLALAVADAAPAAPPAQAAPDRGSGGLVARTPDDDDPRVYRPPVQAPVTDPFRPPAQPWLPGNRGLEYATVPGTPVGAIGPGVVVFAGPVAGALYVTVLHPDGLRSSYSYLAAIRVVVGDRVAGGDIVGIAGPLLHLGVRDGDVYIDPAGLWGRRVLGGSVLLVPLDGGPGSPGRGPVPPVLPGHHASPDPPAAPAAPTAPVGVGAVGRAGLLAAADLLVAGAHPGPVGPLWDGPGARRYTRPSAHHAWWAVSHTSARAHPRSSDRLAEPTLGPRLRRTVGKGEVHDAARRDHEATARGRGPLRPPDPPLEPEDEAVHLR